MLLKVRDHIFIFELQNQTSFQFPQRAKKFSERHFLLPPPFCSSPSRPPIAPTADAPLFSDRHTFGPAVRGLTRTCRFSDIEALLEPLKKDPRTSGEPYLASVITSYTAANMVDHALRAFDNITSLGAPRTAVSLNALLSTLSHSHLPASHRRIPDLFVDLSRRLAIAPDKVSYGILVKSHCLAGDAKKALAVLKEMEEKKIEAEREAIEEERQRKRQRQDGVAPLGPTTFQSPATRSLDDPHRHPRNQWLAVPPPVALLAVDGTSSPAPAVNRVALDLNATPAEEENEEEWGWSSAYKAARARKRRLEIQREKNNGYPSSSSSSPSSLSMAHKMPRFK